MGFKLYETHASEKLRQKKVLVTSNHFRPHGKMAAAVEFKFHCARRLVTGSRSAGCLPRVVPITIPDPITTKKLGDVKSVASKWNNERST